MTDLLPIGVALGSVGATAAWWLESARRLDAAGYRGLWCWDHFVGQGDRTVPVVEQWTILAAAAGATSRIGLGTFVTNVMNRHPAVVARMAGTLQGASGGRFTLGIGIGGAPREHRAYGIEFPDVDERVARLEEAVAVIRALWTGGPVTRPSRFYPLLDAHAFVWVASDHRRLTKAAKGAIQDHPGLSRVAAWLRPGLMEIASSGPHEPGNGPGSDEGHTLTFRRPHRGLQNMEPSCDPGLCAHPGLYSAVPPGLGTVTPNLPF